MGSRHRARVRAAKAKRSQIVSDNLSSPKPELVGQLVRAKDGSVYVRRAITQSADHSVRLVGATSASGYRDNLRGGNPEDRPFVAIVARRNAAADIAPTWHKGAPITETPEGVKVHDRKPAPRATAKAAKRFALADGPERLSKKELERKADVDRAFKLTQERFRRNGWTRKP